MCLYVCVFWQPFVIDAGTIKHQMRGDVRYCQEKSFTFAWTQIYFCATLSQLGE